MDTPPNQARRSLRALAALLSCFAGVSLTAQDGPPLDSLLAQLRAATPAAWQARAAAMEAAAKQARVDAEGKRAEAKANGELGEAKTAAAKAVLVEIDKLTQLRAMVATMTFRDPAGGAAEPTESGRLERAIAELRAAGDAAWQARAAAMQAEREALERAAAAAKQVQDAAVAAAAAKDAEAAMLDAERQKLTQLQQLVGSLQLPAAPMAAAPAAMPAEKPAEPAAAMPAAKPTEKPTEKPAEKPAAKPAEKPAEQSSSPPAGDGKQAMAKVESDERLLTWRDDVYPIFDANCIDCHDVSEASGGLDLSSYAALRQGGGSGRTLKPGDPDGSRLYLLVAHKEKPTMPPDEPRIDAKLIETIRSWIAQGAPEDAAAARGLASARATARQKEAARKAAAPVEAAAAKPAVAVMPSELPKVPKAYPMRTGALRAVAASPLAPLLAVPGFGQVLLLHQDDLHELGVLPFPSGQVEVLQFAEHGASLLAAGGTAGKQGEAVLYDVRTGQPRGSFGAQADAVLAAAVAPDASLLATGGTRRRLDVWRVADGQLAWQTGHDEWLVAVAFSPDGKLCASADRAGTVQVREAQTGREVHTFAGAEAAVTALAFSPDSSLLATAGGDRGVAAYRMSDARRLFRQQAHRDEVLCLTWRSDARLVSGGADGRLMHWKPDGNREPDLPTLGEWVYGVAAGGDGARLFAVDWQGRVSMIDVATRKTLATVQPLVVTQ